MRVTSDFFVSALMRRVFNDGGFAAIISKGASEAGAIFIITRNRMGEVALYGPASQTFYDEAKPQDRQFTLLETDEDRATARLEREKKFDSDIWTVELEVGKIGVEELLTLTE